MSHPFNAELQPAPGQPRAARHTDILTMPLVARLPVTEPVSAIGVEEDTGHGAWHTVSVKSGVWRSERG
jgi:hypothetical protein